ncbi:MAG: MBOAT family protein [Erysipelotrichaceae bacterium]|nr:MBOAT family protein [Erysipelotrichaceae bacterium]
MLFSSTVFLYLFLPLLIILYYTIFAGKRLAQNVLLLIASLFFYAWGEPKFVVIMIASIIINWLFGIFVDKYRSNNIVEKVIITLAVVFNLFILFVFKYLAFASNIVNSLFDMHLVVPNIALPIGISFFTFQGMSYVIDVYRQKGEVQTNLLNVGLYISFFPQLIAGPIVRYETVANEINYRKETLDDFVDGFARFIVGMAKKVLLANSFALLADTAFDLVTTGASYSVGYAWFGAIAYTFQIFFDFSGYSDMAIGLGRMFGFHFLENFNYPYISTSISEFWRRWHMSLGTWFRDYLYFPLGGSRVSKNRVIFNLFVVWAFTGLWHGANLTFVIWGLMYFVLITFEKLSGFEKKGSKNLLPLKWIYTMFFVVLGFVIFRADNLSEAIVYIRTMFGINGNALIDGVFLANVSQSLIIYVIAAFASTPIFKCIGERTKENGFVQYVCKFGLIMLFILSVSSLVSNSYNPFIYFNF